MRSDNMPREADIVERLRGDVQEEGCDCERCELFREAAEDTERLRSQIAGLLDQHFRDSKELSSLCQQRDDARRSADYWKGEHLAANVEIDRLSNDVAQLRDLLADLELTREGSRVAHAELKALKAQIEAAPVEEVYNAGNEKNWYIVHAPEELNGKRVRLVVCD